MMPAAGQLPTHQKTTVDADNPWPGLASFREADRAFFRGRDAKIAALVRLILRSKLTLLYGVSGLGKTSLLRAGVFPTLRSERILPVYVRLRHTDDGPDLREQVLEAIAAETTVQAPSAREGDTLWEYFHRKGPHFWNDRRRIVTPLLVFDQFEELFTQGRATARRAERANAFVSDLADLVSGHPSAEVSRRFEADPDEALLYMTRGEPCKILLSLREDFLAELGELQRRMPSLRDNFLRLERMSAAEAIDVVQAGDHLVDPGVAEQIVEFVAAARSDESSESESVVEPAILSVFCRELNNKRQAQGRATIGEDLLAGSRSSIINDFYERTISEGAPDPGLRLFVEEQLLTESGYRDSVAEEQALRSPGVSPEELERLVARRLLRREESGARGLARIELTHDVLAQPVRQSRNDRRVREEESQRQHARAAADRKKRTRRLWWGVAGAVAVFVVVVTFLLFQALGQRERANSERDRANSEASTAITLSAVGNDVAAQRTAEALAKLARAVRIDPENLTARSWVTNLLARRVWALPVAVQNEDGPIVSVELGSPLFQPAQVLFRDDGESVAAVSRNEGARIHRVDAQAPADELGRPVAAQASADELTRTAEGVWFARFSPEGTRLVALTDEGAVVINAETREVERTLVDEDLGNLQSATFSPDNEWVALVGDRAVGVWDPETGERVGEPLIHRLVTVVDFSEDGRVLVTGDRFGAVRVWDLPAGTPRTELADPLGGRPARVRVVAVDAHLAASGNRILTAASNGNVRVWDATTGAPDGDPLVHAELRAVAMGGDGRLVVTGSDDGTARLWRLDGEGPPTVLEHGGPVAAVSFSPDGVYVVTASSDSSARVWAAATGAPVVEPIWHEGPVEGATFSPDGSKIVTISDDGSVRMWRLALEAAPMSQPKRLGALKSAHFAPSHHGDADLPADLVTVGDGTVGLWNTKTGEQVARQTDGEADWAIIWAAFAADQSRVLTVSERAEERRGEGPAYQLRVRDSRTLDVVTSIELLGSERIGQIFLSADGSRLVTLSGGASPAMGGAPSVASPALWALSTGDEGGSTQAELIGRLEGHEGGTWSADMSADGLRVVTVSEDGTARLWDGRTGEPIGTLASHLGPVYTGRFSSDGQRIVTASADRTAMVWNVDDPSAPERILRHHGRVFSAAFSRDGKRVGTVSEDRTARLWLADTGEAIGEPMEHDGPVVAGDFNIDGTRLLTLSLSRAWSALTLGTAQPLRETAHLWNGETGEPLGVALEHPGTFSMAELSPDGSGLVTVSSEQDSLVWDLSVATSDEFESLVALARAVAGVQVNERGGTESLGDQDHARAMEDLDGTAGGLVGELTRWFARDPTAPSPPQVANQQDGRKEGQQ